MGASEGYYPIVDGDNDLLASLIDEVASLRAEFEKMKAELGQTSGGTSTDASTAATLKEEEAAELRAGVAELEADQASKSASVKAAAADDDEGATMSSWVSEGEVVLLSALATVSGIGFAMYLLVANALRTKINQIIDDRTT